MTAHVVRLQPGGIVTTENVRSRFAAPAATPNLQRAAAALTTQGFTVEILDSLPAARQRVRDLIPPGTSVLTGASETLRLSGIEDDINTSGHYDALRPRGLAMDRTTQADDIRRMFAAPDIEIGSVAAVTETGSLVIASGSGSQLPGYAGGAAKAIWIVGAQKVVPDLATALQRVEEYCLPLENERCLRAYGRPSAITRLLILNAEYLPGRGTVLPVRRAVGF